MPVKHQKFFDLLAGIVIGVSAFFVYSNTFWVPFQFDDIPCIKGNPAIMHIKKTHDIFRYWPTRFITYLTFALNYKMHGFRLEGYHIINLLIHITCSLFVWQITKKLLPHAGIMDNFKLIVIPFIAGLIFALHPVQTQAVTYIYQRHTCLATSFILSALLCWIKTLIEEKHNIMWLILSFISTVIAMFTKEISIVIPFLILMYFFHFKDILNKMIKPWQTLLYATSLFMIFISIILLTNSINPAQIKQIESVNGDPHKVITQKDYLLTQGQAFLIYFKLLFFPIEQNIDYDVNLSKSLLSPPETLLGYSLFLTAILSAVFLFKKNRIISFAAAFFVISILPQSSIIPKPDLVVEHRLYLPMVGYAIFLPCFLYSLKKMKTLLISIFLICVIIFYGFLTYQRNVIWNDPVKLWSDAIIKSPFKARPYLNRGLAHAQKGEIQNALNDYTTALNLNPWYIEAYNNRGIILASIRRYNEALNDFNRAIELKPDYAIAYNNRGVLYFSIGQWEKALNDFDTALKLKPFYVDALKNRGIAFLMKRNFEQAKKDFSNAIEINPKNGELYNYRAIVFFLSGKKEEARTDALRAEKYGYSINPILKTLF